MAANEYIESVKLGHSAIEESEKRCGLKSPPTLQSEILYGVLGQTIVVIETMYTGQICDTGRERNETVWSVLGFLENLGGTEGLRRLSNFKFDPLRAQLVSTSVDKACDLLNAEYLGRLGGTSNLNHVSHEFADLCVVYGEVHRFREAGECRQDLTSRSSKVIQALYRIAVANVHHRITEFEGKMRVDNETLQILFDVARIARPQNKNQRECIRRLLEFSVKSADGRDIWDEVMVQGAFWGMLKSYLGAAVLIMADEPRAISYSWTTMWKALLDSWLGFKSPDSVTRLFDIVIKLVPYAARALDTEPDIEEGPIRTFEEDFISSGARALLWSDWDSFLGNGQWVPAQENKVVSTTNGQK